MRYDKIEWIIIQKLPEQIIKIDFLMNYKTINYKKKYILLKLDLLF